MRDFCFVDFATIDDSSRVVDSYRRNGFQLDGQEVHISFSKVKRPGEAPKPIVQVEKIPEPLPQAKSKKTVEQQAQMKLL